LRQSTAFTKKWRATSERGGTRVRCERVKQDVRDRHDTKFEVLGSKFRTLGLREQRDRHRRRRRSQSPANRRQSRPLRLSGDTNDLSQETFLKGLQKLKGGQVELTPSHASRKDS